MITTVKSLGTTILERIGNTPLVRLETLTAHLPGVQILGKAELINPGRSRKDRAVSSIVTDRKKQYLKVYGAEIVWTNPADGSDGAIRNTLQMIAAEPERYYYPDQY